MSLLGVWPGKANAAAWNQPTGHGIFIFDYTLGEGSDYFNGGGRLAPTPSYAKSEWAGYLEYGVTDWLMAVLRPAVIDAKLAGPDGGRYVGVGGVDAGAQLHLLAFGPAVLALQGTFHLPGTTSRSDPAEIGNTARESDLRVLGGINLQVGPWPGFVDVQSSIRLRSSGAAAQWHGDFTFGVYPNPRLLILAQSFTSVPVGPGTSWFPDSLYSKVGLKGVYSLTQSWAVQVGVFTTVTGRNALRERGVTTGVWYRF